MTKSRIISSYLNLRWLIKADGRRVLQQHVLVYEEKDRAKIKHGRTHREAQEWVDIPEIWEITEKVTE